MSVQGHQETAASTGAIRPFNLDVPEAEVEELRRRVLGTRWPDKETVDDRSQGVRLEKLQDLVRYWGRTTTGARSRRSSTLFYWHEVDRGGHFAAWEQPQLFSEEVRAGFRPLRWLADNQGGRHE